MNDFDKFFGISIDSFFKPLFKTTPSLKDFTENFYINSNFKLIDDKNYEAKFFIGENVSADNINVNVNSEEKTISISYNYKEDGFEFSSNFKEIMPVDTNYDTLNAVLNDGYLIITFEKKEIKKENKPINVKITHV